MTAPLIICLGNPLRGDDGLGPSVGRCLRAHGVPGERLRIVPGLLPELAADVAAADAVVFVDASAAIAPGELRIGPVTMPPSEGGARWTHQLTPSGLLALAAAVYGRVPPAVLVEVGGRSWDIGAPLSPEVRAAIEPVAERVAAWDGTHEPCGATLPSR